MLRSPRFACFLASVCAPLLALGCGSSDAGPVGGPVMAALDTHCTVNGVKTKTEIGMCIDLRVDASSNGGDAATDAASDAATSADGASSDGGGGDAAASDDAGDDAGEATGPMTDCAGLQSGGGDFGATRCNSESDDDDCKYHVAWTSSPIRRNKDVTFDVTATRLFDGTPATGADITIEAFSTLTHPTPSVDTLTSEATGGKYRIGPVQFDQPGKWTVRFHLYQFCADMSDDSPHGHAAFYVSVP